MDASRPAKPVSASTLPTITETNPPAGGDSNGAAQTAPSIASVMAWSAATADPAEMKSLAVRAQAAKEQAVADLMEQVRQQQQEELKAAVEKAVQDTKEQMQKAFDVQLATELDSRLREAADAAAEALTAAVSNAVSNAKAETDAKARAEEQKLAADALAAEKNRHAQELAASMGELSSKNAKQHNYTLVTSAAMVRQAEEEGVARREQELAAMREAMSKEHADELQAAVQRAQDESATALAQAHIEFTAEKVEFDSMQKAAVAKAVVDTERMVTDRLEAAHRIDKEGLAQRQREFNQTLKKLMQELFSQPDRLASPKAQEAALAIKYLG